MTTLIDTIRGPRDASTLRKVLGGLENDIESTYWVEYYDLADDVLIHRSAHVHIKMGTDSKLIANPFA